MAPLSAVATQSSRAAQSAQSAESDRSTQSVRSTQSTQSTQSARSVQSARPTPSRHGSATRDAGHLVAALLTGVPAPSAEAPGGDDTADGEDSPGGEHAGAAVASADAGEVSASVAAMLLDLPEDGTYAVLAVTGVEPEPELELPDAIRTLWHSAEAGSRAAATRGGANGSAAPRRAGGPRVRAYAIVLLGTAPTDDFVRSLDPPPGARVGVGAVVRGVGNLPRSRELAERALRVSPDEAVAALSDRLPAALVADSPDLAALIVTRALGPVLELPDADRDSLLNTLRAWLESGGSTRRAGDRLFYHPNTVLNRLRRYEQLTGRLLADPATIVELSLALDAYRLTAG